MITINTILDMRPGAVPKIIHLSQYDSDFSLVFRLHASFGVLNIESGTTAEIRGTKKSGTGYSASATLNVSNNTVTVTGDAQMTAVAGQNIYEIVLTKNNKVLGSANFILLVERAALDADTITDATVLRNLEAIVEGAETASQAAEDAEDAADRAETAAQSLEIDPTPTQGSAHAVSSGGVWSALQSQSAGLSEDAKVALLACFEHVAWTDEHGQNYYDALENALYNTVLLMGITADYLAESHVVYPYDTLDSLKSYIVVTAVYSDGTTQVVTDYTLSGNLDLSTSIITVAYQNKTAQVSVSVTIDSDLAYYVTRGTELNGVDSGFSTGYMPSDTNKAVTIVCDFTDTSIVDRGRSMSVIYNANSGSGYAALVVSSESGGNFIKQYAINCYGAGSRKLENLNNASHRMRFAFTHAANSNFIYGNLYVDNTVVCENVEMSAAFAIDNTPLYVGKRPSGGYLAEGVINLLNIYNRVLTQSEIKNLLGVN